MDIFNLPSLQGWPGLLISVLIAALYMYYQNKNVKAKVEEASKSAQQKAQEIANEAQKSAIDAMQLESQSLRRRIEDIERDYETAQAENTRLQKMLEAILEMLKTRDIHITVQGHMITVREGKDTTVTYVGNDLPRLDK